LLCANRPIAIFCLSSEDRLVRAPGIDIDPGTYAGGVTIDASVSIVGAGADRTTISGGGPVVTIGVHFAPTEPTVSIRGVTITGGTNTSAPFTDFAKGGGVWVPPALDATTGNVLAGATVTLQDVVVSGNSAAPADTEGPSPDEESFWPHCPGTFPGIAPGFCPFAQASGGGIAGHGALTLDHVTVRDNTAGGPVSSDAGGGGIWIGTPGTLTLRNSSVVDNTAVAGEPDGRFAEGGGIFMTDGTALTIHNSTVSGNTSALTSSFPFFLDDGSTVDMNANGGGIHNGDGGSTTIDNSHLDGNTVTATDPNGEPAAFDGALCTCGENALVLTNSTVDGNKVVATVGSQEDVGPSGPGAFELDGPGTVTNIRVDGNSTTVTSPDGAAEAIGAIGAFQVSPDIASISNSEISGNTVEASSTTGSATIQGAGLVVDGVELLRNDRIEHNSGAATAPSGSAQGGGIFNGVVFGSPPVELTLQDTHVDGNMLTGSSGIDIAGGGLYTVGFAATLAHSHIDHNTPDDCAGC
jgi:hypothetical protein